VCKHAKGHFPRPGGQVGGCGFLVLRRCSVKGLGADMVVFPIRGAGLNIGRSKIGSKLESISKFVAGDDYRKRGVSRYGRRFFFLCVCVCVCVGWFASFW
jgi:hypothetical protein